MIDKQLRKTYSKEFEFFYCSILLDEIRDRVRKLRLYGVNDSEIESALHDDNLFPSITITKEYRIVLSDREGTEIKMEPLVKAVYLLFLSHPEGIILKNLPLYRKELMELYKLLLPSGLTERAKRSVKDVTNPVNNSINEKCARIRRCFLEVLSPSVARYYAISGRRGEAKMIELVRTNVIWECKIPSFDQ